MKALLNKILEKVGLRQDPIKRARKLGVHVGDDCRFIQIKSFGSEPYLVRIGNHVSLTAVTFITHDGATWVIRDQERYKKVHKFGAITIKDNSFVGHGTVILPGVTIGPNSIVGACSLVTKDVPPNTVWGGVPAHQICTTEEYAEKCLVNNPPIDEALYKMDKQRELIRVFMSDKET